MVQLIVNKPDGAVPGNFSTGRIFAASSLSNSDLPSYAPGWIHSEHNGPGRESFEWTNGTAALSTVRILPVMLSMTNSLFD